MARLVSRLPWRRASADEAGSGLDMTPSLDSREVRQFLERAYGGAIDRRVRMLAVFTAGRADRHNYRTQMLEAFPNLRFGELLQLEYFGDSDHTFTSRANRARLLELMLDWLARSEFGSVRDRSDVGDVPAHRFGESGAHVVRRPVAE
jgi:hypothetical protein